MRTNVIRLESRSTAAQLMPAEWARPARAADDLVADYVAWGRAFGGRGGRGWSEGHAGNVSRQLRFWVEALELRHAGDLASSGPLAWRALAGLKAAPNNGQMSLDYKFNDSNLHPKKRVLGDTSIRSYGTALKAFCAWLVKQRILESNPVENLTLPTAAKKRERRALTVEEIHRLLSSVPTPRKRLYELALNTGFRANELRSVRQADCLSGRSAIRFSGRWTKNRRDGTQPLASRILESILSFGLPAVPRQTARSLRADLRAAGIRADADGCKVDFHALRVTFATLLDAAGASEKEQQVLMRHASSSLTFAVYTKTSEARLLHLVEKVAAMIAPPRARELELWD